MSKYGDKLSELEHATAAVAGVTLTQPDDSPEASWAWSNTTGASPEDVAKVNAAIDAAVSDAANK